MNIIGIIPARMESSRFPGKPLKKILGMPMIGHVFHRCQMSKALDAVYVATCNKEIYDYIESIGGIPIMTSKGHERASDRTFEAMRYIITHLNKKVDIVVMLQGDEPMIFPDMVDAAVEPLIKDPDIHISNLMTKVRSNEEWKDPNEVKVVTDNNKFALYFSREPIPSNKKYDKEISAFKQVCVIPFKVEYLKKYNQLSPTSLEIIESVDMNRFLEHGYSIKMVETEHHTLAVDTPDDLKNVERKLLNDTLNKVYNNFVK